MARDGLEEFRSSFGGQALLPDHVEYDGARSLWNGAIDRRPAVIARCTTPEHVAEAIAFARRQGLEIAVRGGGHNYAGHAVCDGGMMIHLGAMNQVRVDAASRRATCGGGTTWAELDAATQQHGLAVPGGFISHTGVGGLTLGGGVGWLSRKAGLSCDNLVGAEVVTADGRIVRASRADNPDLLWALQGGGGNFGVVTSFEFALHPLSPLVHLGLFFFELERGSEALRFARGFVHALPDDATGNVVLGMSAPPAPFVPAEHQGRVGHAILIVGFGSAEEHAAAIEPVRAQKPLFEMVTPIPYVALQKMFDEEAVWGLHAYQKALYFDELSDAAIAVIGEHSRRKPFHLAMVPAFILGGAYREVGEADTAFGGSRSASFILNIEAAAVDRADYETGRAWVRDYWEAMRPHASGSGSYVNFLVENEEGQIRSSYGREKYARLARIKAAYDPDNVFHLNANIRPEP